MEPDCITGSCPTCFDQLNEDDFRILEVHWLISHLSEMGLSAQVVTEYNLDRDDLFQLAMIQAESRKIAKSKEGEPDGEGR